MESLDVPGHASRPFYEVYFPGFQNKPWRVSVAWRAGNMEKLRTSASLLLIWKYKQSQIEIRQIEACSSNLP